MINKIASINVLFAFSTEIVFLYYTINFGPQHPAAHGVLRLIIYMEGERVFWLDPHIGLLHRGTEKLLENKTFLQGLPYFARLDYVASMSQEHVFCMIVELLLDMIVSKKESYLRILFLELSRLLNHILALTTHALDVGAMTPFLWGFEEREKIMEYCERASGARMHTSYFRFGGVYSILDDEILKDIGDFSNNFLLRLHETSVLLSNSRIWKQRLRNIGNVNFENVINYAFTGPLLRSAGYNWDLRKHLFYENYENLNFFVPFALNGDCYDRFLIRLFEMKESIHIIQQVVTWFKYDRYLWLNLFEEEDFDNKINQYTKTLIKDSMESLIHHFKLYSEGFSIVEEENYIGGEAPKGEFGVYLETDGSNKPYRCKIRAPGFFHLQGLNYMSKKHLLADVVTVIGTQDIVFGEIDR